MGSLIFKVLILVNSIGAILLLDCNAVIDLTVMDCRERFNCLRGLFK